MTTHVGLELIKPNPYQPDTRIEIDPGTAEKFGRSIQEHGLLQTPIARRVNNHYEMGDGWMRLSGYRWLVSQGLEQYKTMPIEVRDLTDRQMADLVMEANTVRKDLNIIELANFYKRYLEDFRLNQTELAKVHNISQGEIANTIRLLELPEDIQQKIISHEITHTHGRMLLRLNDLPELQKEMLEDTIEQNLTINQLDQYITREIWDKTRSLKRNDFGFDVKTCDSCEKRILAADPWGDSKKQYRCMDTKCWDKKQDEAEAARAAKIQAKANSPTTGIKKILTGKDLGYDQYQTLKDEYYDNYKEIDDPEQCNTCDKTAHYKYRADDDGEGKLVCLNPNCYRQKKSKKTRQIHKVEKQQDQELTAKLKEEFNSLFDIQKAALIVARDVIGGLHNSDAENDMLFYFPDLPIKKDKRIDAEAILKSLANKPLDQLLRICAAGVITRTRREYAGDYSPKLTGRAKEYYDTLTKSKAVKPEPEK